MAKYSKETVEAAIEVLLCTADNNFSYRQIGRWFMTTHDNASDSRDRPPGPIARLADAAWRAIPMKGDLDLCAGHAGKCLEAAQLLREGWLPGDEAIEL